LNEAGNPTEKYFKFREVIQKYVSEKLPDVPPKKLTIKVSKFSFSGWLSILNNLEFFAKFESPSPLSFEDIDLDYG
jgi:beta-galactosidase